MRAALALILLALVFASSASADMYFRMRPATHTETQVAQRVAITYWREHAPVGLSRAGVPLCGMPKLIWRHFTSQDIFVAETPVDGSCRILFDLDAFQWPTGRHSPHISSGSDPVWPGWCTVLVHEWGHLILGPDYYAAVNPTDPAHSPNPHDVMYAEQIHTLPGCRARGGR